MDLLIRSGLHWLTLSTISQLQFNPKSVWTKSLKNTSSELAIINTLRSSQNVFFLMKAYKFSLQIYWYLFPRVQVTIYQHWFRWWFGAIQATSHYLKQWWLFYWCTYASLGTKGIWVDWMLDPHCDFHLWPHFDLDLKFSMSDFEIAVSHEWEGRLTWNERDMIW